MKRREKYQRLRQMGYSADEARRLRGFKFDVNDSDQKIRNTIRQRIESRKSSIKITESKVIDKKSLVNKKRREKYQRLRQLGYSPDEARRLRGFKFDVKTSETKIKESINERLDRKNNYDVYSNIINQVRKWDNLTERGRIRTIGTQDSWGFIVHNPKYKDRTMKIVSRVADRYNITEPQAYHLIYTAYKYDISLNEAMKIIFTEEGVWQIS
ncbi:MAG: hypothetical protein GX984_06105 [Erysipelothrix sp.]|nr:hypothetical protein [Erysipelothrix sp.]